MQNQFTRTELLIGDEAIKKLHSSKVAVFGIGGVGSYVVEALARAGVGHIVLIDNDYIDITNINRQIHALHSTIGRAKVEVEKERVLDINPNAIVEIYQVDKIDMEEELIINESFDYIVDSVDTITTKLKLIKRAKEQKVPIISCMGTANKLDATKFEISDIYKTSVCPLCKIMRKELKQIGITELKVVYSKEEPKKITNMEKENTKKILGSISFVPSVAGLIIACEVVKDIM